MLTKDSFINCFNTALTTGVCYSIIQNEILSLGGALLFLLALILIYLACYHFTVVDRFIKLYGVIVRLILFLVTVAIFFILSPRIEMYTFAILAFAYTCITKGVEFAVSNYKKSSL
ncbi:hypothetical protein [Spirosoma sp.]|uniref:hypothetical protein n=1 Tax=Spirosoma sp. TaxID=1899569 RepID=UPI003B3A08F4